MIKTVALRGAASVAVDSPEAFRQALNELWISLFDRNQLTWDELVSLQFTQTADLQCCNSAAVLRSLFPEAGKVPLFCAAEPQTLNSLPRMIRLLVTLQRDTEDRRGIPSTPVYLGEARSLRPDLAGYTDL